MAKSKAFAQQNSQVLLGLAFILSVVAGVMLLYLFPSNYSYNRSGLAMVLTVLSLVLIVKTRTRNVKAKPLRLAELTNMEGVSSVVNLLASVFVLFLAVKSLVLYFLPAPGAKALSVLSYTVMLNPIVPMTVLSALFIWLASKNTEAKKLSDWSLSIVAIALLLGLLHEFFDAAPALLNY
jgi:TctA family transporter